ncbi:MAG: chromosome segregation protein SMC [Pseudomonadales bacterium]
MRLKSIKLAGFKSFVDPTSVNFPTNMSAVVGPNGCGKSNIIDAVRWVMGESSAKNLRGEHMTDVIFNGSNSRKPVGHATIELIFDNTDGTLGGEYASFSEIAIRRKVTRESESSYYLNGTKCRRKDITDIFLGTGLGPRSYAIIEQGMISKLVEAKPDELRVFVEEAAGISRYKERRRDTENRIRRTKENLERLTDIREELERQLQHLQRQSQTAERYRELKTREREQKAQLQAIQWRELDEHAAVGQSVIRELEVKLEATIAERLAAEAAIEKIREAHIESTDKFNLVTGEFYSIGGEIARDEQRIQGIQERDRQLRQDQLQAEEGLTRAREHMSQDEARLSEWQLELAELEPELELTQAAEEESTAALLLAEENMQHWQHNWDEFNNDAAAPRQQAEVQQSRIQHLDQVLRRAGERVEKLETERSQLTPAGEDDELALLQEQLAEFDLQVEEVRNQLHSRAETIARLRQELDESAHALDEQRSGLQSQRGRYASLEALQQAAMGHDEETGVWLSNQQLDQRPRLADCLSVKEGWEAAVETVLGSYLQAVQVDDLAAIAPALSELAQGSVSLYDSQARDISRSDMDLPALADQLSGGDAQSLLAGVYCADDLGSALQKRHQLAAHESVITRDGIWIGVNWLRLARDKDTNSGVIQRQQDIEELNESIALSEESIDELEHNRQSLRERLALAEEEREQQQSLVSSLGANQTELTGKLGALQARQEQTSRRREQLNQELEEGRQLLEQEQANLKQARRLLQESLDSMEQDAGRREELLRARDSSRSVLDQSRQKARHDKDNAHHVAMRLQSLQTQLDSVANARSRLVEQSMQLEERQSYLTETIAENMAPLEELKAQLEQRLEQRLVVEERMGDARKQQETLDFELRENETRRNDAENRAAGVRSELESNRLQMQTIDVRRKTLVEQLQEAKFDLQAVLATLTEEASEKEWSEQLEKLANRINRLGPINLAAIDEYQSQAERKNYLDAQNEDLVAAMDTLENAIRKIDRETRARFKETFDEINSGLQELFPKVFGGGEAYLELTGDDMLDTGISIMARPPGKKNSTIALLSGGEKALTAIALVFAIFRLNPAPFCMLDEVDAPLDDANVGRYARMVKEMSEHVQFIYISHNKITMEYADQLMGVTMHEPGCSRLVTVDIEEAAELAAM